MTGNAAVVSRPVPPVAFALVAAGMLATPILLFALGCARDSVFLVDASGSLFGIDAVLVLWLRDLSRAPNP